MIKLSPKTRRNISRIIPFGLIWLVTGWVFMTVEVAAMGTPSPDSETIINLTFSVFVFASIAVTFVGLLVGAIEMIFIENLFRKSSFLEKILYKLGIYLAFILLINFITYPIAASFESDISLFDQQVWDKFGDYLASETFLSTILQMSSSILLCLIYAGISENLGHSVLVNFFTGKYHKPREEKRIFMFLDMKSSTAIAEKLGHIKYFELLREYYSDLSEPIINALGEVYQYIGDEIVMSWKYQNGLKNENCLKVFFEMEKSLQNRYDFYIKKFGVFPSFKAGLHFGQVTTGEIGALKKEIFFTGDVLNVTSRIQGLCNELNADLLVSSELLEQMYYPERYLLKSHGLKHLKGRSEPLEIFSIAMGEVSNNTKSKMLRKVI
jgi:adenylate cyclase